MKKLPLFYFVLACTVTMFACTHGNNTSLSYNETSQYYSLKAHFNESKSRDVDEFMNRRIGRKNNFSFTNIHSDAVLTLDDQTKFYMKKYPGFVEIKMDKEENSDDSYLRIKSMCEGLKKVLTK